MNDLPSNNVNAEALAVAPRIAKRMLGCGITRLYDLLNRGELQSYRDGKSRRIVVASLKAYIARQIEAEATKERRGWTERATEVRTARKRHGSRVLKSTRA